MKNNLIVKPDVGLIFIGLALGRLRQEKSFAFKTVCLS